MIKIIKKYNFIYKTTNIINGKIYIGKHSTDNINDGYLGSGTYIKKAIKKYGRDNFSVEIILHCIPCIYHLDQNEIKFITEYNSKYPNGYNLADGGGGVMGVRPSEETRAKMRLAQGGSNHPLFGKMGSDNPNFGSKRSEETKRKISEKAIGRISPLRGTNISEERKLATSKFHKGKTISLEQRLKLSIAGMGRIVSEETRLKLSNSKKGENNNFYGKEPHNKGMVYPKVTCPYCGRIGGGTRMISLHFDKCKYKNK